MFDDVKTAKKGEKSGRFWVWPYRIFFKGLIHYFESKYESFFCECLNRGRKDFFHY